MAAVNASSSRRGMDGLSSSHDASQYRLTYTGLGNASLTTALPEPGPEFGSQSQTRSIFRKRQWPEAGPDPALHAAPSCPHRALEVFGLAVWQTPPCEKTIGEHQTQIPTGNQNSSCLGNKRKIALRSLAAKARLKHSGASTTS